MSIIDAFTGEQKERERKERIERLGESMSRIAAEFGITTDELTEFLRDGIAKKRPKGTERNIDRQRANGIRG